MMAEPWIAALFALFVWWFSTGAILFVVKLADRFGPEGHRLAVVLAIPVLLAGIVGFQMSLDMADVAGAYLAFLSALAIWGWVELAFLTGMVTGPRPRPCPEGAAPWDRFTRALGTILYHEALLVSALCVMAVLSAAAANPFAFWTFGVLFFARVSAKLNLFFGVPQINTEFLPVPLAHLSSHFRHARMNPFFPLSVTALAFAVACWLERIYGADTIVQQVGFALLAALTALALLEHWLMVLPLPDAKLWRWMLPAPKPQKTNLLSEDPHGL